MAEINRKELIDRMADNLPMLRTKLNFTQDEIAQMIGVSRHTIISIENKKRHMTWNTFLSLILVFSGNPETKVLMQAVNVLTDDLADYLMPKKKTRTK